MEWDEPGRGKHDGTTNGTRHFECPQGQGSFIKERKVDERCSLVGSIVYRYCGGASGGDAADSRRSRAVVIDARSRTQARFIGMEQLAAQQSDLTKLTHIALVDAGIAGLSWPGEAQVRDVVPNICELDLAGNLLSDWAAVEGLGTQLDKLQSLDLRGNRLHVQPGAPQTICFPKLRVLVLNGTRLSWENTVSRSFQMPALTELHIASNGISTLRTDYSLCEAFPVLELLDLDNNGIQTWSEIWRLSDLPNLTKLTMNHNLLENITVDTDTPTSVPFAQLKSLSVSSNNLGKAASNDIPGTGWYAINALDKLSALADLRCSGNPLFGSYSEPSVARNLIIGRVRNLQILDGSAILATDRVMAEKQYLRQCHTELHSSNGNSASAEFTLHHPRFASLNALYEDVRHEKFGADAQKSRLASNLIEINIRCSIAAHVDKPPATKRVTLTMTVGKLKALCNRLFKVKGGPRRMRLVYIAENETREVCLEEWDLDLQYYSMASNGTVMVSQA